MLLPLLLTVALLPPAWAAGTDRFPMQAEVTLPDCPSCAVGDGVYRIAVPPVLRTPADPESGTDLQLVGPDGAIIPIAIARGAEPPERVNLRDWPQDGGRIVEIDAVDRPIDGIHVRLPRQPAMAEVRVEAKVDGAWVPWGDPARVWEHELGDRNIVALPATRGPLRVSLTPLVGSWRWSSAQIDGIRWTDASVPEVDIRLPVAASQLEEDGWSRHVVPLPGALPVTAVTLHAEGEVFSRSVAVEARRRDGGHGSPDVVGVVQRVDIGGAAIDLTRVPVPERARGDHLIIYVQDVDNAPLVVPEVTVHVEGLELLVRQPGAGPWTLQAGAAAGTGARHDLNLAIPELRRLAEVMATVGPPAANPAYRTPEDRSGLAGPGPELDLSAYTWRLPVDAPPGLTRIALPAEAITTGDPAYQDIRIVTEDGRQVPRVLQRSAADPDLGALTFTREEQRGESLLRVPMPAPLVPVATVTLETDALLFSRRVTLQRVEGGVLVPVRSFRWVGEDRPSTVSLHVDTLLGEELVVTIDNGDDPPLPITGVWATRPGWEALAVLPDAPVWIYGGRPDAGPPEYDLGMLAEDLDRRAAASATAGPPETLEKPPPSPVERAVLFGGLGVLVAGLGLLTLRLLRAVPAAPAAAGPRTEDSSG